MAAQVVAILQAGLVSSVGLSAQATCAALRAGVTNPQETRFMGGDGEWIMGHPVTLAQPWRARTKLVKMAALAVMECLEGMDTQAAPPMPCLLCVAESDRPARLGGLDATLFNELQAELGLSFDLPRSAVAAVGRPGVLLALAHARRLIHDEGVPRVLIVATDSLLHGPTLSAFDERDRLLRPRHANGFVPGEAAGALLIGPAQGRAGELQCIGVGAGHEPAHVMSEAPLRADGLCAAIKQALAEAGCQMHELDFRITDISGEQYFFKEATLALSRTMRTVKEAFDIWHPAECTGETGAAVGAVMVAQALLASRKGYALGSGILLHASADAERRAAVILRYLGSR